MRRRWHRWLRLRAWLFPLRAWNRPRRDRPASEQTPDLFSLLFVKQSGEKRLDRDRRISSHLPAKIFEVFTARQGWQSHRMRQPVTNNLLQGGLMPVGAAGGILQSADGVEAPRDQPVKSLMNIKIRPESPEDRQAIWNVNQAAFGGSAEANLVDALRDGGFIEVSLVAEEDGELVGHILISRVTILTKVGTVEALSLAPMAVLPSHQRQEIGSRLVELSLESCRYRGHSILVVLGHPEFYPRFGFSANLARPLESAFGGGKAWMCLELVPGALTGVAGRVEFSPPFSVFE